MNPRDPHGVRSGRSGSPRPWASAGNCARTVLEPGFQHRDGGPASLVASGRAKVEVLAADLAFDDVELADAA